jgi:hypothetical protein
MGGGKSAGTADDARFIPGTNPIAKGTGDQLLRKNPVHIRGSEMLGSGIGEGQELVGQGGSVNSKDNSVMEYPLETGVVTRGVGTEVGGVDVAEVGQAGCSEVGHVGCSKGSEHPFDLGLESGPTASFPI